MLQHAGLSSRHGTLPAAPRPNRPTNRLPRPHCTPLPAPTPTPPHPPQDAQDDEDMDDVEGEGGQQGMDDSDESAAEP